MKRKYIWVFGLSLILIISYFAVNYFNQNDSNVVNVNKIREEERKYVNLTAFAKLFGYIHYFHPSDESTEINWNLFAIYGAEQVTKAKNDKQLISILEDLFIPIAPTIVISKDGEDTKKKNALDDNVNEVIAWQHYGVGTSDISSNNLYRSERVIASIEGDKISLEDNKLFDSYPRIDAAKIIEVVPGLYAKIPTVLHINEGKTMGSNEETLQKFEELKENLKKVDNLQNSENENVRFAGAIVTWNILQHFYPYFHVTDSKWETQLEASLIDTADDQNREDYISSLSKLLEKTEDGHAELAKYKYNRLVKRLPFVVDIIENSVVVTAVEKESGLLPGDIIISMNQRKAMEIIEQLKGEIVGSPQYKNYVATYYFSFGEKAEVEVQRGNETVTLQIEGKTNYYLDEFDRTETFKELEEEIYYVNLTKGDASFFIENKVEHLSKAKGIIFDLRGYPASFDLMHTVIGHLIDEPIRGPISRIPKSIYPDKEKVTFDEIRDPILPVEPMFNGKVVFLSYSGSISMPEYFLGYIKDNQLAEIVGQPTAGSDGNVQKYQIPGNLTGIFTGLEVLNADRSQTHTIGILPTSPIERTIEGVKNGVDEYIQKALELITN